MEDAAAGIHAQDLVNTSQILVPHWTQNTKTNYVASEQVTVGCLLFCHGFSLAVLPQW